MKSPFIFAIPLILFFCYCSPSNQLSQSDEDLILAGSYQQWFATAPGKSDISERGIDLFLELQNKNAVSEPLYIIFNERKSFPATLTQNGREDKTLKIQARILLESALFVEVSDRTEQSDRLVYLDDEGTEQFEEINNWERLDDRYD